MIRRCSFLFSQIKVPSIDLTRYLAKTQGWESDCREVADILHKYGLIYVRDSRVTTADNDRFIDMMEQYFAIRSQQYDQGLKNVDVLNSNKPVGLNQSYGSKFVSYRAEKDRLKPPHQSLTPYEPAADPTWRLRWILDSNQNINPPEFPQFRETMNSWGAQLRNCNFTVAEMAAVGFGLDRNAFTDKIKKGDYYLSPTGIDLTKTVQGQVLTGFHHDYDFFTVHGKSRYAGLYAWLNTGQKFRVDIPEGHLLVQAGKQLEWLTGGYIKAGFHEVIHNEQVEYKKQEVMKVGQWPWRIASVIFCQVEGELSIKPLHPFSTKQANQLYPDVTADQYLKEQIRKITQETS